MPRIPESEIERIKQNTDLSALVRSRGIELKKHGSRDLAGCCPFHDDKTPSFVVTPSKGLFHCLGCGAAGNAIQFVQRFDGVSFRHAFELLNDGPAAFESSSGQPVKAGSVRRLECPFDPEAPDSELLAQVAEYYHERLLQTPAALEYLEKRGLKNDGMIARFKLGFSDRTLGLRLPNKNRADGKAIRERLQSIGILRETGHELMTGSLTVPIFDQPGFAAEMYGRKITSNLRKGTPLHLYLPGPHDGIWNRQGLSSDLILCEAPLDALSFWANNFDHTTFIYGCHGFTDELFKALVEHNVQTVRLAYDADDAGNRAAERDAKRLAKAGIDVYRIKFPLGMDANEYASKAKAAYPALHALIKSAEPMEVKPETGNLTRSEAGGTTATTEGRGKPESGAPSSLVEIAAKEKAAVPEPEAQVEQRGEYRFLKFGPREYRIGGLDKNNSLEVMKIALRLRHGEAFHLDAIDLMRDGDRRRFIERAHEETRQEKEVIKRDLGKLLLALEREQEERLAAALKPETGNLKPEISEAEREEAIDFLKSPELVDRLQKTFDDCGLVGEQTNRLAAYLACTSRKLARPLAVIIQSTSAAGKSALMDAVLAMFPDEEQVKYSAMTGQSLYYLGETNLKHRILAIVEEEGAEKASYALKLLQSEGELTIASTGKDAHTGRMETQEYHVEGPVMIFLTTTAIDIDEELLNRCLVLTVDETKEQTERIHALQRQARTLEGLQLRRRRSRLLALMRNVQRLLDPVDVVNPFAGQLTFTAERTRTRRDHEKYLTLIDSITLLHQHQRLKEKDDEGGLFIRVTLDDIGLANKLAPELLARSLDELPPQTRRVLEAVKEIVRTRCEEEKMDPSSAWFSRRQIRDRLGWSVTQVREHLERLREFEYVAARAGRAGSPFQYELLGDCEETDRFDHIGLLDVQELNVRSQPVGKKAHLSEGCRDGARQVQPVEEPGFKANLSACSERTSGAPVPAGS